MFLCIDIFNKPVRASLTSCKLQADDGCRTWVCTFARPFCAGYWRVRQACKVRCCLRTSVTERRIAYLLHFIYFDSIESVILNQHSNSEFVHFSFKKFQSLCMRTVISICINWLSKQSRYLTERNPFSHVKSQFVIHK